MYQPRRTASCLIYQLSPRVCVIVPFVIGKCDTDIMYIGARQNHMYDALVFACVGIVISVWLHGFGLKIGDIYQEKSKKANRFLCLLRQYVLALLNHDQTE